ncbi:MAG: hypothetical protein F7C36_03965 [Desulfurococcales archaeon]|nr:hypothetical protein [Desulfurococcales archaeon]
MDEFSLQKLEEKIKARIREESPGLYGILDLNCKRAEKKSCIRLLLEKPEKFVEVLSTMYDEGTLFLIVRWNFIRPIFEMLGIEDYYLEESLTDLLFEDPQEFKEKLDKLLNDFGKRFL